MNRVTIVLLAMTMGWMVGCATPQTAPEDVASGAAPPRAERGADPAEMRETTTLRMRAPTPAAAMRPRDDQAGTPTPPIANGYPGAPPQLDVSDQAYRLRKGDPVIATFRGIPAPFTVEDLVDEQGVIALPYIGDVLAVGHTSSELEKIIKDLYVPDYYRYMNVNVLMPTQRSIYVQGAVRGPGRQTFTAGMTLMQVISTAGGYTDFAQPKRIKLLRGGRTTEYNMIDIQEHPETDVTVQPNDVIIIPEKWY